MVTSIYMQKMSDLNCSKLYHIFSALICAHLCALVIYLINDISSGSALIFTAMAVKSQKT